MVRLREPLATIDSDAALFSGSAVTADSLAVDAIHSAVLTDAVVNVGTIVFVVVVGPEQHIVKVKHHTPHLVPAQLHLGEVMRRVASATATSNTVTSSHVHLAHNLSACDLP